MLPARINIPPTPRPPRNRPLHAGSTVELAWAGDMHNAYWLSTSECPTAAAEAGREGVIRNLIPTQTSAKLSDFPDAQRAVTATKGTFWLVCTVDAHCQNGMKIRVTVV